MNRRACPVTSRKHRGLHAQFCPLYGPLHVPRRRTAVPIRQAVTHPGKCREARRSTNRAGVDRSSLAVPTLIDPLDCLDRASIQSGGRPFCFLLGRIGAETMRCLRFLVARCRNPKMRPGAACHAVREMSRPRPTGATPWCHFIDERCSHRSLTPDQRPEPRPMRGNPRCAQPRAGRPSNQSGHTD